MPAPYVVQLDEWSSDNPPLLLCEEDYQSLRADSSPELFTVLTAPMRAWKDDQGWHVQYEDGTVVPVTSFDECDHEGYVYGCGCCELASAGYWDSGDGYR